MTNILFLCLCEWFFLRPWLCFFLIIIIVWGYDVRTIWETAFLVSLSATFLLSLAWLITEVATLTASLNFIQTHNHNNAALDLSLVWCDVNFNILSKAKYALLILVCCQPWGALNMEELDGENIEQFEEKSSSRLCSFVLDMHFHLCNN